MQDDVKNTLNLIRNLAVGKAQCSHTNIIEGSVPPRIVFDPVSFAIDFDRKHPLWAKKIHDVAFDYPLPTEFVSTKLRSAEVTP